VGLGVAYGTDLDRTKQILIDICNAHPKVLENPPPQVYFTSFGDSSLDLKLVCRVAKWGEQWGVAEELRMEINRVFKKEGIEIPFPQRVVTMKKEE
jgi:small-conductance mechanosensitive channel